MKRKQNNLKDWGVTVLFCSGYLVVLTHWRDPTTARHGNFWLLGFPPGPFRSSLYNLHLLDYSNRFILMPSLVRTPFQHVTPPSSDPELKPSTQSSLPVAGLQVRAKHPADGILAKNQKTFTTMNSIMLSGNVVIDTLPAPLDCRIPWAVRTDRLFQWTRH